MSLSDALELTAELPDSGGFDRFKEHLPLEFIERVLELTGTATVRKRRLPAEVSIWIVLAIAMYRNRPVSEVVEKLDLALPAGEGGKPVAASAIVQARQRLGEEPLAELFKLCGRKWGHESAARHPWRGLKVYGVDGSSLRVPDSLENREHFGCHPAKDGTTHGYPLVRVVALMALRSHVIVAAQAGSYLTSESAYAAKLWSDVPDGSLTVLDKGFFGAAVLLGLTREGSNRHYLVRIRGGSQWKEVQRLGEDDFLVELTVSAEARQKDSTLPKTWQARAVRYQRKGFPPSWLLTSLLDADKYPRGEIVEMYHERWELELGFDELKTEVLDREEALRSKSPSAVMQEIWGVLLSYDLIRVEMERIAEEAGVLPIRISFTMAMRLIADEWMWCASASPGAIPKNLARLRQNVKRFVLPARRSERAYPRAVKVRSSQYPKKKPSLGRA